MIFLITQPLTGSRFQGALWGEREVLRKQQEQVGELPSDKSECVGVHWLCNHIACQAPFETLKRNQANDTTTLVEYQIQDRGLQKPLSSRRRPDEITKPGLPAWAFWGQKMTSMTFSTWSGPKTPKGMLLCYLCRLVLTRGGLGLFLCITCYLFITPENAWISMLFCWMCLSQTVHAGVSRKQGRDSLISFSLLWDFPLLVHRICVNLAFAQPAVQDWLHRLGFRSSATWW